MTRPDVMMLCSQRPDAMQQLEERYTLHRYDLAEDKDAFVAEFGPRCRAIATNGHAPVTRPIVEAMPDLRLVSCSSAGFDGFDVAAMAEHGVTLTNTSQALCDDVADTAIMLLLAARRGLVPAEAYVRSGDWARKGAFPLQRSLKGGKLGIVGMGTIGQAIAERAKAMGQQVTYWNRRPKDLHWDYQSDLIQLARDSDALVVIVAGGESTRSLIDTKVMEALGPTGLLINVARGSVVDEEALIACLSDGRLGSAALDVYASEPDADPRLTSLPNVTLYPHHASGTVETRDAMAQLLVDNLGAFFAGQPLLSPVDLTGYLPTVQA
ncbi:2-hydroxyacid dehydrogenase [Puniceibacterium sediminis]|uniref:Lactate dehydrogenase n=1 Tax=Puniceibacterium sediminis TaxID=1608407 RepID=A0A238XEQ4_9RHOB|nr:2-hydroxyacid dehydrogenase [Puniceibacterium sediminis]SNR56963.1 Lactate dehydrogenase [Puniceibacterium sediminis]